MSTIIARTQSDERSLSEVVEMLEKYQGFIHWCVNRFYPFDVLDRDELVQIATIAIWKAFKRFDPGQPFKFTTYAFEWIKWSIVNAIRRELHQRRPVICWQALSDRHERPFEVEQSFPHPINKMIHRETVETVKAAASRHLPTSQQVALQGFLDSETQYETGKCLGVSDSHVAHLKLSAIEFLSDMLVSNDPDFLSFNRERKMTKRRARGEGNILKCRDGRWRVQIRLGFDASGKRLRKDIYGKSRSEVIAKAKAATNERQAAAG